MKVRCICGNLMHDENQKTCDVYYTLKEDEYFNFLESDIKSIEEFVDKMPMSDPFWQCSECERLIFFRKGTLKIYNFEREILD